MKEQRYLYLLLGILIMMFSGAIYAWTIICVPIKTELMASNAEISMCFTICMMAFCLGGFFNAKFLSRLKMLWNILIGAALYLGGIYIAVAVQNNMLFLYIGYGAMVGLATGIMYNVVMGNVVPWFPERVGFISGILLMFFGLGSFTVGKVFQALISNPEIGWRMLFVKYGFIILLVYMLGAMLLKKPPISTKSNEDENTMERNFTSKEMLHTKTFWLIFTWCVLAGGTGGIVLSQANGILHEVVPQIDGSMAATLVGLVSIFNGLGRGIYGYIYDKKGYKTAMFVVEVLLLICAVALIAALKLHSVGFVLLGFITGGLFYSGAAATSPPVANEFFGKKYYATNYSILNLCLLISSFGSTLAGWMYDTFASYLYVAFLLVASCALTLVLWVFIKKPE